MKKIFLIIPFIVLFFVQKTDAQINLIPNPSFESYDSIVIYNFDSSKVNYAFVQEYWYVPVPNYFIVYFNALLNNSNGNNAYNVPQNPYSYTYPKDGNAFASFNPFWKSSKPLKEGFRNYLEVPLLKPLLQGHQYCLSFYVTLGDSSYIAIDQIGAHFSNNQLYIPTSATGYNNLLYFFVTPQVVSPPGNFFNARDQWQVISGTFVANGGEQYMTIGNFKVDSLTNWVYVPPTSSYDSSAGYHIDMVTLIECDNEIKNADAGKDSTICMGDSIQLGLCDTLAGYEYYWSPGSGLSDSNAQCPIAKPQVTTTYTLQQTYFSSNLTTDEVTVIVLDCSEPKPEPVNNAVYIPNSFTPNNDGINDMFAIVGQQIESMHLTVYDGWGFMIFEVTDINKGWDGKYKGRNCPNNVYCYAVEVVFKNGEKESRKGTVTLIR